MQNQQPNTASGSTSTPVPAGGYGNSGTFDYSSPSSEDTSDEEAVRAYFSDARVAVGYHVPDYDLTQMADYAYQQKRLERKHPNGFPTMVWQDQYIPRGDSSSDDDGDGKGEKQQRRLKERGEECTHPAVDDSFPHCDECGRGRPPSDRQRIVKAARALGMRKVPADLYGAEWVLPRMRTPLMNHQVLGVHWMVSREQRRRRPRGGLLADTMGMGKTIQAIATICRNPPTAAPTVTLIVTPFALLEYWRAEIERHCMQDALRVHVHHGAHKLLAADAFHQFDVVLCTYQGVLHSFPQQPHHPLLPDLNKEQERRWWSKRGVLHRVNFWRVILDESQHVKNSLGQTSLACQALSAVNTWALSGTPIQNRLEDILPIVRFLRHPRFAALQDWRGLMGPVAEKDTIEKAQRVKHMLKGFMLRRTKDDKLLGKPLITLPEKRVGIRWIKLLPQQWAAYQHTEDVAITVVNQYIKDGTVMSNALGVLSQIMRLRQICNHPYLALRVDGKPIHMLSYLGGLSYPLRDTPGADGGIRFKYNPQAHEFVHSSKTLAILEQLEVWRAGGRDDKIVVFSLFTKMLDIVEFVAEHEGWECRRYQGGMSMADREAALEAVRGNNNGVILLVSIMTGSLGLNLTFANRVICTDLWWNPGIELQAFDRVHRLGQTKEVEVLRFVTGRTIETRLLGLQRSKLALALTALDETGRDEGTLAALRSGYLTEDDMLNLIGELQRDEHGNMELVPYTGDMP